MSAYNGPYNLTNVFGGPTLGGTPAEYGITGYIAPYQAALFLFLPVTAPLTGYAGGSICSVAYLCLSSQDGVTRENSGVSITGGSGSLPLVNTSNTVNLGMLIAETPEPSSFVLMATGLAGLAGLMRRLRTLPSRDQVSAQRP